MLNFLKIYWSEQTFTGHVLQSCRFRIACSIEVQEATVLRAVYQGWRFRGPASVSRPASRPNLNGLDLGLGCPCLGRGLGLGGPGFVFRVSRTGLGLEAGLET